jgi:hypothetical protein
MIAIGSTGETITLVNDYPTGGWTSVRLEIDLAADNFDVFAGLTDTELPLVGNGLPFRSGSLDHLDRFTVARFEPDAAASWLDNVEVSIACPWDCVDGDGEVTTVDFFGLIAEWGMIGTPCDFDGNGVDVVDFFGLIGHWGVCP